MPQYVRTRWGTSRGFPHGPVYAIAQSGDGYLWIGTQAGLVRFDGLNFQLIHDSRLLRSGEGVLGLVADREGNLWIRTEGSLLRYRDGIFEDPTPQLNAPVSAMARTIEGDLLIAVMEQGAKAYRRGALQLVEGAGDLPRSPVLAIAQTRDKSIWSGTRDAGLFRVRDGTTYAASHGLPDLKVNCLVDEKGRLWVGTDGGIVRQDGGRLAALPESASLNHVQVLALERDGDGNIWAGTDSRGVLRIKEAGISYLDAAGVRSQDAVTALFEDREGDLWIGRDSGVERVRDSPFRTWSAPQGLPAEENNAVFVDPEDRVWFAPATGGLWWMRAGMRGRVSNDGLDRDVVYSIAGSKDELWIARRRGGLTQLRPDGTATAAHTYTTADGLAQNSVFCVYAARDGSVWAGTLSGGVSRFRGGKFTTYTRTTGLLSNTVRAIVESADGTMWFATSGGLNSLMQGHWQAWTEKDHLPSENVYCIFEDSAGVLWVGTSAGLAFRDARGIRSPAGTAQWLREPILGIAQGRLGSLWVATSNRVLRVNRDKLVRGTLSDGDVREYGEPDGLPGSEVVRRYRSVSADPFGRIWLCMSRGLSVVDPARLEPSSAPVIVHVQMISADGSAIPAQASVHIPGGRRRITFEYVGLSLSAPDRVRFRYRLDGYDSSWSDAVSARQATYTGIGPGAYRFRVVASNPDGAWKSTEGSLVFEVDPLFWEARWFRVTGLAAFLGLLWAAYRSRIHQLAREFNLRLDERIEERTRIARELHDTLLQSFHGLMLRFQTARNMLPGRPAEAAKVLESALDRADQAITEGRDAIQNMRSSTLISNDLAEAVQAAGDELVSGDTAEFRLVLEGRPRNLHPVVRDEVYRIAREAIRNAFRHARARVIEAEITYAESQLRLRVRDDGNGIEPAIASEGRSGHYGVPGMRERAAGIGARLNIWAGKGAGTEVELIIPGSIAFGTFGVRPGSSLFRR